jgi:hypothetical protein
LVVGVDGVAAEEPGASGEDAGGVGGAGPGSGRGAVLAVAGGASTPVLLSFTVAECGAPGSGAAGR